MSKSIARAILPIIAASGIFAQSSPPVRPFEVASIRQHQGPMGNMGVSTSGQRLNGLEFLRSYILFAYDLKNYQLIGPQPNDPIGSIAYDIVAKAEGGATPSRGDFRQMLQLLLADRFKLKFHREIREMEVYALVVGKSGPKLKVSAPGTEKHSNLSVNGRNYDVTLTAATIEDVVGGVANSFPGRPVVDHTALTGTYDVKLTYTPDVPANRGEPGPNDISIFTAVQQLGLKLEPQKAQIEVLVIDQIEKPTEN